MIPLLLLLVSTVLSPTPLFAVDPPVREIQKVIQNQLKAFKEEDYTAAYTYASRQIHRQLSLERFERMVRSGYPQIARSERVSLGPVAFSDERRGTAQVTITGSDHTTIIAEYQMTLEEEAWKIDGVIILERMTPI